ncbi:nuclear transport factor 2 family protein [Allokutzneria sp. A3M-2-11 16]|uniref:nuclear transport factor 2 family protein n=1 Tax=Allokutzneria sp. A3M-2-11 16 TaxID=2962043 RepID=UPI0020B86402|nr:nuclear transport factor 2 family protein [Allokutzneria sp. A3M-2-11 16]MCP3801939.1 nuclear transport factor 2 family protein [Allokutzneria sp. A3M-2-11 16]
MAGNGVGLLAGPREAFERFRDMMLAGGSDGLESLLADDGVVEAPFAPPGAPRRFEGRDTFVALVASRREGLAGRVRFTAVREVVVHDTADPEVAVIEFEVEAVRLADGLSAAAPFAVVVRVQDGRVVLWREYQDPAVMALVVAEPQT